MTGSRDRRHRGVARRGPASSPSSQIGLLQTFADQAVIAIENVRLFTELEARNRELTEALEQQTATARSCGSSSSSPTDVEPVLDAIVESAARLCGGAVRRDLPDRRRAARSRGARTGSRSSSWSVFRRTFPARTTSWPARDRAVLDGVVVQCPISRSDAEYQNQEIPGRCGMRSDARRSHAARGAPIGAIHSRGAARPGPSPASRSSSSRPSPTRR